MIIRVKIPLIIEVKNIINKNKGGDLRLGPRRTARTLIRQIHIESNSVM